MARAERALAILRRRVPAGERVLDLGCGPGFGTAKLARYFDAYGLEAFHEHYQRARLRVPNAHITHGVGEHLPYPDGYFAAVVILDVLEHVDDDKAVIAEIARVLRPGGLLIMSVPNGTGILRWLDSNNVFMWLTDEDPWSRPGTPRHGRLYHRHYGLRALARLLGDAFTIDYTHFSGLGVAEFVNLCGLVVAKHFLRSRALYLLTLFVYTGVYIVEDLIPFNQAGYHLMIAARRAAS